MFFEEYQTKFTRMTLAPYLPKELPWEVRVSIHLPSPPSCTMGLHHRPLPRANVTIPPLDPSACDEEEPDYDEEAQVWAAAMEHAAEVEDEETLDEYDWQISCLVSTATYTAGPDAGRVSTGRMKIT